MAVAVHIEVPDFSAQQYAALLEAIQPKMIAAPGFLAHAATPKPEGVSIVEMWRTKEDYDAFIADAFPAAGAAGLTPKTQPQVRFEEISKLLTPVAGKSDAGAVTPLGNDDGETFALGPITIVVKEDGSRSRQTFAVAEFRGTDFKIPPHTHTEHDEILYVVEGEMQMLLGDKVFTCKTGDSITIPIGMVHSTWVEPGKHVRFLNTIVPARYLDYFHELALAVKANGLKPEVVKPVMQKYGLKPQPAA